jgi:molybdopterin-guanine dinucleotide biosynthesis protein A
MPSKLTISRSRVVYITIVCTINAETAPVKLGAAALESCPRIAAGSLAAQPAACYTRRRGKGLRSHRGSSLVRPIEGISAIVLAGGRNTRMEGRDKCSLALRGRPLLVQVVELLRNLFAEVIVVTNRPAGYPGIPAEVRVVEDRYQGCGPLGGLQAGLEAVGEAAAFCAACDMPYLDAPLIRRQVALYRRLQAEHPPAAVLLPRSGSLIEPLHGVYSRELEPTIRSLLEDGRGYSIRRLFARVRTCYLELPETAATRRHFFNLNSPEDVQRWKAEEEG